LYYNKSEDTHSKTVCSSFSHRSIYVHPHTFPAQGIMLYNWSHLQRLPCTTVVQLFERLSMRTTSADPSCHTVLGVGVRPLACWDYGFEPLRGHGCLSLVRVAFCQIEVSASDWSLVQRSPTECGVCERDHEASITDWLTWAVAPCEGGGRSRGMMIMWNFLLFTSILFALKFYIETNIWDRYSTIGLNYR
jgi:hypothetical protein